MASEILTTLLGALQASLSVLLVIFYGVLAAQFDLLDNASAKKISQMSVKLFLPFLLITKVGNELSLSNAGAYIPILIWSVLYNVVSLALGWLAVWMFPKNMPRWVIPAVAFNNTTSLPLLLLQSMESTGILNGILKDNESAKAAIERAQSYFLVCAVVSNCLTFAIGPILLEGEDDGHEGQNGGPRRFEGRRRMDDAIRSGSAFGDIVEYQGQEREERERLEDEESASDETTSLLPDRINDLTTNIANIGHDTSHALLHQKFLHPDDWSSRTRKVARVIGSFFNSVLVGAIIGFILGLVPFLHKAFFADTQDGGVFTAWLTQSLKNTGELFVTLQVIIVGVKLSSSLRRMKRGEGEENSGKIPWAAASFVFFMRYIFWPVVGIPIIYGIAKTGIKAGNDGVLWFALMLMATGPPAMSLIPMADVSGTDEKVKMSVAKLLTAMYGLSPVLAFVVVTALKASQEIVEK